MPAQKISAPERPTPQRIAGLRAQLLHELYREYDRTGIKSLDLEQIERDAVNRALAMPGGHAVTVLLDDGGELVRERLTILTSVTRGDRVAAVLYSVRIGDGLTQEFPVTPGGPYGALGRIASHVACHTL